jgi:hypothetical protein
MHLTNVQLKHEYPNVFELETMKPLTIDYFFNRCVMQVTGKVTCRAVTYSIHVTISLNALHNH